MNDETKEELDEMPEEAADEESTAEAACEESTAETPDEEELDEADAVSEYNDVAAKIADLEESLQASEEKYLRLFAEYDNYRKRTTREKSEIYQDASIKFIKSLLPIVDSFERSIIVKCHDHEFKKGMKMIFDHLLMLLDDMNVKEIDPLGLKFDPELHSAVTEQPGTDYEKGYVSLVFQKGYFMGDKLIRPAMVAVAS